MLTSAISSQPSLSLSQPSKFLTRVALPTLGADVFGEFIWQGIYIYIYRERERNVYIYIYIYTCVHYVCMYICVYIYIYMTYEGTQATA